MKQIILEKKAFLRRLKALGFKAYKKYLESDHWNKIKKEYKKSGLPQKCLNCNNEKYILHHRSYVKIGDESLFDFIPFAFGRSKKETKALFKKYQKKEYTNLRI